MQTGSDGEQPKTGPRKAKCKVLVDDNFHYRDEDERYELGSFDDRESAVAACQAIVDEYLTSNYEPGLSAADLLRSYQSFGPDPFIVSAEEGIPFSAWNYAARRCREICDRPLGPP